MAAATSQNAKQTKSSMIIFIILTVFFIGAAIVYAAFNWSYMVLGKTVNLNSSASQGQAPVNGDYATLNVRFVLGNYAETKHTYGFIPIGTEQHYAIILDDGSIMSLTLKSKSDIEQLEAMVNPTWDYLTNDGEYPLASIEMTGKIKSMDSKVRGYFKEALNKAGATTAVFPNIYELTLDATDSRLFCFLVTGFLLLLAAGCFALVMASKKKLREFKNIQSIAKENAADPSLNPFLQQNAPSQGPANPGVNAAAPFAAGINAKPAESPYAGGINMPGKTPENPYAGGINMPDKTPENPYAGGINMPGKTPENPYAGGINMPDKTPENPYAGGINMPDKTPENPYAGGINMPGKASEDTDIPDIASDVTAASDDVSKAANDFSFGSLDDILDGTSGNSTEPNDSTPETGYDIPEFDPFAEFGVKNDNENK